MQNPEKMKFSIEIKDIQLNTYDFDWFNIL